MPQPTKWETKEEKQLEIFDNLELYHHIAAVAVLENTKYISPDSNILRYKNRMLDYAYNNIDKVDLNYFLEYWKVPFSQFTLYRHKNHVIKFPYGSDDALIPYTHDYVTRETIDGNKVVIKMFHILYKKEPKFLIYGQVPIEYIMKLMSRGKARTLHITSNGIVYFLGERKDIDFYTNVVYSLQREEMV